MLKSAFLKNVDALDISEAEVGDEFFTAKRILDCPVTMDHYRVIRVGRRDVVYINIETNQENRANKKQLLFSAMTTKSPSYAKYVLASQPA